MRITFSCPSCAKPYDLPLSLAGKKARCKKCSAEFQIPSPVEGVSPRSSEAIPVASVIEPPPPPRKTPVEIPKKPAPPPVVASPPVEVAEDDDEPWPDYALATPGPAPTPNPEPVAPITPKFRATVPPKAAPRPGTKARPSKSAAADEMAPRPRWFVPTVVFGSFAVVFLVNFGVIALFLPKPALDEPQPQQNAQAQPANVGDLATNDPPPTLPVTKPKPTTSKEPKSLAKDRPGPANPSKPKPPAVEVTPPIEETPDRVLNSVEIAARYEASVALIKGKKGSGTGFIVKPGILATNAHVIDGERAKDLEIRFPSAEKSKQGPYPAKILFQDRDRDLALLGVITELAPVRIAEGYKFVKGEDVTVIGNPGVGGQLILENAISRGLVSSMATINEHSFIQLSISINPGNSGGPVFDAKGRVIGVVTLKTTKQEGLAFAIPIEDVVTSLDTAEAIAGFEKDASEPKPAEADAQPKSKSAPPKPKADVAQAKPKADADADASKPKADPAKPKADAGELKGEAPTLAYAWKQGQTYVYSFEETLDLGANLFRLEGCSIYRVKAVDNEGITLTHRGWYVQSRRSKDGYILPNGISEPTRTSQVEVKIDPQGEIIRAMGSSPLPLLGDFSMLLIEPLPDEPRKAWNDSKTITLNEVDQAPGSGGAVPKLGRPGVNNMPGGSLRQRIQQRRGGSRIGRMSNPAPEPQAPGSKVTSHEATEETTYILGERDGAKIPIRKLYELAAKEMVGNDPRFTMSGQGIITFDIEAGLPVTLDYELKVVETSTNVTFRLPITVRCKLLEGREKTEGLEPPVYTPTAMNKIDADQVEKLASNLDSTDNNRRRQACQTLRDSAPLDDKRLEIARSLERLCRDKNFSDRGDAIKALAIWGDEKTVEYLISLLNDANFGFRDETFEALARLSPTEATAEVIVPWMYKDRGRAQIALDAIGEVSEGPILRYAEQGTDKTIRILALQFLKEHGSTGTLDRLKKIAAWRQDGEVGGMASDVAKQIRRRYPSADEMAAMLRQLRSSDAGKRREAADRFGSFPRVDAIQPEVARALERVIADTDDWAQSMAFKALAIWGDDQSRERIIERLEDMDMHSYRDAIDTLVKFGPNELSARAIARWIKKDRRHALGALGSMGAVAEDVAIAALKDGGQDGFLKNDLCKLLGKIGTGKSLAVLKELATGKDPREPQAAIPLIEERVAGTEGLSLIDELRKNEGRRRRKALEELAELTPSTADGRAKVARALELLWESSDNPADKLREATIRWGDARTATFLEDHLNDPDFKMHEDALRVLAGLRPDAKTGELVVAYFKKNGRLVYEIGQKIPTLVERPLVKMMSSETEIRWRLEPCKALGIFGTPAVLADLDQFAKKAGDAELAANAAQAVEAITSRQ